MTAGFTFLTVTEKGKYAVSTNYLNDFKISQFKSLFYFSKKIVISLYHFILLLNPCSLGVNFINVFTSSFYNCRSRKRKKLLEFTVFLRFLGSASLKAARKMLVILILARLLSLPTSTMILSFDSCSQLLAFASHLFDLMRL